MPACCSARSCPGCVLEGLGAAQYRDRRLERGPPEAVLDRVEAFDEHWGGLVLPPAPTYNGGPKTFCPDTPEAAPSDGWWFWAGDQRAAVPYAFMIGPRGEFGLGTSWWVPLHASVGGWVESVALAHHAAMWAKQITKVTGEDVDALELGSRAASVGRGTSASPGRLRRTDGLRPYGAGFGAW